MIFPVHSNLVLLQSAELAEVSFYRSKTVEVYSLSLGCNPSVAINITFNYNPIKNS